MKKLLYITLELLSFGLLLKTPAFADLTIAITAPDNVIGPNVSIGEIIGFVVGAAVVFGIIMALLFVVQGAFLWITSGGDKGKVESARNHIVAAIIGLIVIVLSIVIVNFALQVLGIGDLAHMTIRTLKR